MLVKLWNDYEGKTIAEVYPLEKLLRPEGRSAFFVTYASDGAAEVIRITESLNDEEEMLDRWRQVSAVRQANLVEIRTFGVTTFDGVPLTYAVMEGTDGSLAEILQERPLTTAETMQVATSVMAALTALHAIGLVHEHLEPASVVATGEVVKLRSDCIRACLVDAENDAQSTCDQLQRRDVHDVAVLLLQCLTLERQWTSAMRLPPPFEQVIRRGLDGTWGLAEMMRALERPAQTVPAEAVPVRVVGSAAVEARSEAGPVRLSTVTEPHAAIETPRPEVVSSMRAVPKMRPAAARRLHLRRLVASTASGELVPRRWLMAGAAAFVAVLLAWFSMARTPVVRPSPWLPTPELAEPVAPKAGATTGGSTAGSTAGAKGSGAPAVKAVMQPGWHVIAYTYLHEGQAAAKAATVTRLHPGLHAKVFAPAGREPYFVELGGGMSESEAAGVLRTARREGLPRDTFIRLYRSR